MSKSATVANQYKTFKKILEETVHNIEYELNLIQEKIDEIEKKIRRLEALTEKNEHFFANVQTDVKTGKVDNWYQYQKTFIRNLHNKSHPQKGCKFCSRC